MKGQILELRARRDGEPLRARPPSRAAIWSRAATAAWSSGRLVEEQGFDTAVTADGVFRLLEAAWEVLPEVGELELVGARPGLPARPTTAVVGPSSWAG